MRISSRLLYGTLVACTLEGCGGIPPTNIEVNDNSVFVPNLRAGWNLTGPKETPSEPRSGHGIEFGALTASGSGSQSIGTGQLPVYLGDKTFSSPQTLQHDFRFTYYDVFYRWRRFFGGGPVGLEVLVGAAYTTVGFKVSSPTQQAAETFSSGGPSTGVGVIWRMRPGTSLQARYAFTISNYSVERVEGFLVEALGQNASVRAGYAWWKVDAVPPAGSEILINFSGPSLGLELQF